MKCYEYREELEEAGDLSEAQIITKVEQKRKDLQLQLMNNTKKSIDDNNNVDTHESARVKQQEITHMREVMRIEQDYKEGEGKD